MAQELADTSDGCKAIAHDRADWLLDAVAMATQDRRFLRGDPQYDEVAGEAILINGKKAIETALKRALLSWPKVESTGDVRVAARRIVSGCDFSLSGGDGYRLVEMVATILANPPMR